MRQSTACCPDGARDGPAHTCPVKARISLAAGGIRYREMTKPQIVPYWDNGRNGKFTMPRNQFAAARLWQGRRRDFPGVSDVSGAEGSLWSASHGSRTESGTV